MRTAFRASSPMNAFRSSLRTMRRKNRSSRCWRVPFGKKWSWRKANRRMLIVFSPLWRGARISRSSRPASSMSSWRKSSSMRQRPEGQEPDAGDRHLLQGHRSLGNVKSHGINGKKRKRYSRSYTVLSFLTMFSYRELPCRSFRFTPRSHSAPTDVNPNFDRVCKHCECTHSCGFHQPNTKSRHFA